MTGCARGGCDEPVHRRGLCSRHYERERVRLRDRTDRVLPSRARTRAVSRLVAAHDAEFRQLYEQALAEVTAEAAELAERCAERDAEPTDDRKVWRYRPGPRPDDEEPEDRVTRDGWVPDCRDCAAYHAAGHACATCSSPPPPAPPVGSREEVESRMLCSQCGRDGSARRAPCVGVRPSDGATMEYVRHDYTLTPARPA